MASHGGHARGTLAAMSRSILFIFAHPDDESFAAAGTALTCREAGIRTVLVTATRGERGKRGDPPVCAAEEIARCREEELRTAAAIIHIDGLHLLDYQDRQLADAPPDEIRRSLVTILRRERPAIVATFDPNGFNIHPDHVAISRFAADAIAAAADPRWYPDAADPHTVRRVIWTTPIAVWELGRTERLGERPGVDFVLDVSRWRRERAAALGAHRTQHLSIDRHFLHQPDRDRLLAV
jgi:N-acetylglucosamine malate deacetylase 2